MLLYSAQSTNPDVIALPDRNYNYNIFNMLKIENNYTNFP
jgi:hypothetical protein